MPLEEFMRQRLTPGTLSLLRRYTIVADEGIGEWVYLTVSPCDSQLLLASRMIGVSQTGVVRWLDVGYAGVFTPLKEKLEGREAQLAEGGMRVRFICRRLEGKTRVLYLRGDGDIVLPNGEVGKPEQTGED